MNDHKKIQMKMKKAAFKIISILVSIVLFTQCSEKDELSTSEALNAIGTEDIAKIGAFHNECVINMLSDFDWSADDYREALIDRFNALEFNQAGSKSFYTVNFIEEKCNTEKNIAELEMQLSPQAFSIIEKAIGLCENVVSYDNFVADLEEIEQSELVEGLPHLERMVILVSTSIWKNSAYLWLPPEMGGSGKGFDFMKRVRKSTFTSSPAKWSLEDALIADGISGGIGMLGVAVAGAMGPIGWTALAIVAGESAVSSIIGGF